MGEQRAAAKRRPCELTGEGRPQGGPEGRNASERGRPGRRATAAAVCLSEWLGHQTMWSVKQLEATLGANVGMAGWVATADAAPCAAAESAAGLCEGGIERRQDNSEEEGIEKEAWEDRSEGEVGEAGCGGKGSGGRRAEGDGGSVVVLLGGGVANPAMFSGESKKRPARGKLTELESKTRAHSGITVVVVAFPAGA